MFVPMLDRMYHPNDCSVRLTASQYVCEDNFEGGGWALVRRVRQGTTWHPATDNLRGTDVYGTASTSTSDSTFSLPFASLITSSETLILLANGMDQEKQPFVCVVCMRISLDATRNSSFWQLQVTGACG